ncbi:hypothetical protein GEV33_006029 [Tenebrio molitor]|uniref:HTH CENPB-type domain-containing protein n=1 Tax=Tenebrio molitor TaxID=7067 RepID=A0A8J6HM11_TENMO|nr:hypothetical protein GEV33_006029 [Tenebrio molitor]
MPKKIEGDVYQKKYTEDVQNALLEIENGLSKKAATGKYNASVHHFLEANPRQNPFKDNHPGEGWYKGFLRRHQELTERQPEAVTLASANVSEADIRSCFQQIETYLKEEDLFQILDDPTRVFNSDETNFQLSQNQKGALTKEHVASILQRVLKHIKPEIICHGFRASGLYPWNPDAVDYRQEKIGIFQNINTKDDNIDDENFLILYQLYKKFTKNSNKQNGVPDSVPDVNPVTVQEEVEAETSRIIEDTEYFDISNIPIIFSTSPGIGIDLQSTDIPHTPRSSVEVLTETIVGTEEVERISLDIDLIPDSIEFNNNDWNETADNESTLTMANVKKTEEIFATKYDETEKNQKIVENKKFTYYKRVFKLASHARKERQKQQKTNRKIAFCADVG